ncbi:fumarylacetoacetate hydrolase family protein [Agrococcus baldri]|uniref:Fumarylacetoacetate (FAA) hydrolase n=1 Tax=Agrococcus baldri TaxID=153730 RepID=A0AA87RK70_9MICO|nr:fumarylacetoacetate hydrolase family protein [Agrococcus baldri]GEK79647.1 fumarylacetoacetate (FAA) hydrolase [Agrococcus baldri]
MRLATIPGGGRDGTLVVVDAEGGRFALAPRGPRSLRDAIEDWERWEPVLRRAEEDLASDRIPSLPVDSVTFAAPLPRVFEWCEGSTYLPHMERIRGMRGVDLPSDHGFTPAVYQSGGSAFIGHMDPVPLPDATWDLDVEGTIGVVTDDVPIGTDASAAQSRIRLLVLANDLTYRALIPAEYERRVGIYRSKPARSFAPFAVTPDSLGDAWDGRLLSAQVRTSVNGTEIGRPDSAVDCAFDFARLIEQIATTRALAAGSIVGTGTVSNRAAESGYACLAELRAVELAADGGHSTRYLQPGDSFSIEAFIDETSVFGAIRQSVVGK